MSKKFDYIVFIGRFQVFHNGHLETLKRAVELADHTIVLVGSSNKAPDIRNPWSATARANMVQAAAEEAGIPLNNRVFQVLPLDDFPYQDNLWVTEVQTLVNSYVHARGHDDPKIGIIGFSRDHTSFYLDLFPQWERVYVPEVLGKNDAPIVASEIREKLFSGEEYGDNLPSSVKSYIEHWKKIYYSEEFKRLCREFEHVKKYKSAWEKVPYPPTFVTVDAVVVQSGHILLVQRDAMPGEGLWALPGGFINQKERITDAMLRELREETKLKVPLPVLRGSIKGQQVFDDPERSLRGRTITHAFYIELAPGELPPVKGGDDARKAKWFPLAEFKKMSQNMFEDHSAIINYFVGG